MPFSPYDLSALQYWVDAGAITGVADGGALAAADIVDQSANARGAFSARVNLTYRADAGNGTPAIEFNGTDSYGRSPSFTLSQPLTVFTVLRRVVADALARFYDGNTVNKVTLAENQSGFKVANIGLQVGGTVSPNDDTVDAGYVTMVEGVYNGASSTIRSNENNSATGNPGTGGFTNGMIFGTAGGLNAGFFSNYQLLECLVFDSTLSAGDKASVREYLTAKHSLVTRSVLVCDGNSLTSGTGSTGGNTYPAQLHALLGGASYYRLDNAGVGGQTTQQMTADATTDIDPLRDNWHIPILCALEVGNDIVLNALTGAQAEANYATYCGDRQTAGFTVIAMTCFARGGLTGPQETARQDANTLIRANWATYADALCDLDADARLSNPADATYFYFDEVHLNNAGYGVIAELVLATLDGMGGGTPTAFSFTDQQDVAASSVVESDAIEISGLWYPVAVTFQATGSGSGHEYRKNGGAWTAIGDTTAFNADTFEVRLTAPSGGGASAGVAVTVGGVSDTFSVTTEAATSAVPAEGSDYRIPADEERQRRRIEAAQPAPEPTPEAVAQVKEIVREVARATASDTAERRHQALLARLAQERAELNAAYLAMLESERQALMLEAIAAWEREQMLLDDEDAILLFMV